MPAAVAHGGGHVKPAPQIVSRRVGDEAVLVPVGGQADREGKLFILNEVAAFIWDRLQHTDDPAVIVREIVETFQVDEPRAALDLGQFLDDLGAAGCVTRSP